MGSYIKPFYNSIKTTAMISKSLTRSFLMLCCSAATLIFPVQQPVAAPLRPIEKPGSSLTLKKTSSVNPTHKTRLLIDLSQRRVYLYRDDKEKQSYPIAIGKPGWETPTGSFKVMQMTRDPYWRHPLTREVVPPGKDNPLGKRWIGFWTDGKDAIGFHGTNEENLIGQAVSHGCVRMHNKDAIALFDQVSVGTPVIVQP